MLKGAFLVNTDIVQVDRRFFGQKVGCLLIVGPFGLWHTDLSLKFINVMKYITYQYLVA